MGTPGPFLESALAPTPSHALQALRLRSSGRGLAACGRPGLSVRPTGGWAEKVLAKWLPEAGLETP